MRRRATSSRNCQFSSFINFLFGWVLLGKLGSFSLCAKIVCHIVSAKHCRLQQRNKSGRCSSAQCERSFTLLVGLQSRRAQRPAALEPSQYCCGLSAVSSSYSVRYYNCGSVSTMSDVAETTLRVPTQLAQRFTGLSTDFGSL